MITVIPPGVRENTIKILTDYQLKDDTGKLIDWKPGQIIIIDIILHRRSPRIDRQELKRIEIIAATRYGKSLAVGAAIAIRASLKPEKWAIVAGTKEKARIIMEYVIMFSLECPLIRSQLQTELSLDKLKMRKSQDRLSYRRGGEVRVYSADASKKTDVSTSLMGFGSPNVVEDESALVPDKLQATVMRMLGDKPDNFLCKIGNPFHRNHFLRTWRSDRYYKVFIDYRQGIEEGRYTEDYISEMREEALFDILYECKFPEEDMMDNQGWLPLLSEKEIERAFVDEDIPFGGHRLGCDVAGGGRNYSVIVLRAYNMAQKIYKHHEPDTMKFVGQIVNECDNRHIRGEDVFVDRVGIGKGTYDRLKENRSTTQGVSAGDTAGYSDRFSNLRAEMYWRAREWILAGHKLKRDSDWFQLNQVKYKVADSSGKIKIMSKEEMLRDGIDSPDVADALALTFARQDLPPAYREEQSSPQTAPPRDDPYQPSATVGSSSLDPYPGL